MSDELRMLFWTRCSWRTKGRRRWMRSGHVEVAFDVSSEPTLHRIARQNQNHHINTTPDHGQDGRHPKIARFIHSTKPSPSVVSKSGPTQIGHTRSEIHITHTSPTILPAKSPSNPATILYKNGTSHMILQFRQCVRTAHPATVRCVAP